jgi:hypothetical protein
MNLRLTIFLVVVLLLFGGFWLIRTYVIDTSDPPERLPWLYHMDEGSIAHITVAHAGEAAEYGRAPGSVTWMVLGEKDVPVFNQKWSGTTLLLSGPRVDRVLDFSPGLAKYGLDPPETVVRVTDQTGNTIEFHLGIPTPDGQNQYARLAGADELFTLAEPWAMVVNRLALEPPYGRLYEVDTAAIRAIEVTSGEATATYFITETGWMLDGQPPAPVTAAFSDFVTLIGGPRIDRLLARDVEDPEMYGLEPPETKVVVARAGDVPIEFHIGKLTPDSEHRYARVINTSDLSLYAILNTRIEGISSLATDPPLADGQAEETPEDEEAGEGRKAEDGG